VAKSNLHVYFYKPTESNSVEWEHLSIDAHDISAYMYIV